MESLEDFVERKENFGNLTPADKIPFFAFYAQEILGIKPFKAKDIEKCFTDLHYKAYSNVGMYLNQKSSGKGHLFLKGRHGFTLERGAKEMIQGQLGHQKIKKPSNNLFPLEIFEDTRGYLQSISTKLLPAMTTGSMTQHQ